jgi:hypothetical protein
MPPSTPFLTSPSFVFSTYCLLLYFLITVRMLILRDTSPTCS